MLIYNYSMNKTLSVIIPIYNSIKTLSRLLDSILSGSVIPDEILLVNDGSTDTSKELIMNYAQKYSFVTALSQDHKGVSAARNLGLSVATGNWISFLDADDYIEPNMYSLMLQSIVEAPYEADGCICGYYTDRDDKITSYPISEANTFSSKELLKAMFTDDTVRGFTCTRLFRRNLLNNFTFDENISHCEDLLFQTQLFSSNEVKFSVVHEPLYHYVQPPDLSAASKLIKDGMFIYRPAYEKILLIDQSKYVLDSYNSILDYSMYSLLKSYQLQKNPDTLKAIRLIQHEMRSENNIASPKSKRRLAYEHAPVLFSYFLK